MGNQAGGIVPPFRPGLVEDPLTRTGTPELPMTRGPVSDIVSQPYQAPASNEVRPSWMIGSWKPEEANTRMETYTNAPDVVKQGGIISSALATPTPAAPITAAPAPTIAAPRTTPKRSKPKAAETNPYERWKQLGRPGGNFEAWKASQG